MKPPQPKKIPKIHTAHGDERVDDYYWLRDDTRKNPEIISYLEAENKYLESWFEGNNDCRKEIYDDVIGTFTMGDTDNAFSKSIAALEEDLYTVDADGDYVTQLVDGKECAFVFFDEHIRR